MTNARSFVRRCSILADGFVGHPEARWRLGTVLLLRHGSAIAAVQKAANDPAYRFAHGWVLPGGMARLRDWSGPGEIANAEALLPASLAVRAHAEAGIAMAEIDDLILSEAFGPIVTSYVAKGVERFTVIGMHSAHVALAGTLEARDSSVQDARWLTPSYPWDRFTPANCVLIAHALWPELEESERVVAKPAVEDALAKCRAWGRAMGWPFLPAPWATQEALASWRRSWSAAGA